MSVRKKDNKRYETEFQCDCFLQTLFTCSHIPEAQLWYNHNTGSRIEVPKNAGWRHSSYSYNCAFRGVNTMKQSVPRTSYVHLCRSVTMDTAAFAYTKQIRNFQWEKKTVDGIQWRGWLLIVAKLLWNMVLTE